MFTENKEDFGSVGLYSMLWSLKKVVILKVLGSFEALGIC